MVRKSTDGKMWLEVRDTLVSMQPKLSEKALVIAFSALTPEEWEEVLDASDPDDLPELRRLRKLAVHRNWRLKNREQEAERHREFYERTKKQTAKK